MGSLHSFSAVAFVENLSLRDAAAAFPGSALTPHDLRVPSAGGGDVFVYPFGAVVFRDVPAAARDAFLETLRKAFPALTGEVVREEFGVLEEAGSVTGFHEGRLFVDALTPERSSVVSLTVAQSAAMEYYEGIVEALARRTQRIVDRLQARGTVSFWLRPLHRFVGEAVSTRTEVLSVLHLFDRPDATWEDPALDRIYADLRAEFDLLDRFDALERKLRSVQEALELVLDVARDRRLTTLELIIVLLIVVEVVQAFLKR
ncbi:MAG TPA: RMD1 family protein [Thermoanaerobaculia bacterium]|nr:RMD1 family protein [Thermoanaerobaculia bacterium]